MTFSIWKLTVSNGDRTCFMVTGTLSGQTQGVLRGKRNDTLLQADMLNIVANSIQPDMLNTSPYSVTPHPTNAQYCSWFETILGINMKNLFI